MSSGGWQFWLGVILAIYVAALYWLGIRAAKRVHSVEDYVVAGRGLPTWLSILTLTATWFGAESLLTVANEVSQQGIRRSMMDPCGIVLGLLLAGIWIARPIRRLSGLTLGDFFRDRFDRGTERLAIAIMVPSYFGWIAAQLLALGTIFHSLFGVPVGLAVLVVAVLGTGYCLLGGMWSASWTDAVQMVLIALGLMALMLAVILHLGEGGLLQGWSVLRGGLPAEYWSIREPLADGEGMGFWQGLAGPLGAVVIGSIGNLPMQDLVQRLMSAESERSAQRACFGAAVLYGLLGLMPVIIGLGGGLMLNQDPDRDVVFQLGTQLLSPVWMILLVLAIVSTVLSTMVSAVLSPAALLSENWLRPWLESRRGQILQESEALRLQRGLAMGVVAASVLVAWSGTSVYGMLESSYAMGLVGLAAPFLIGLRFSIGGALAARGAMLAGMVSWGLHLALGWELWLEPFSERFPVAQEVAAFGISLLMYLGLGFGIRKRS